MFLYQRTCKTSWIIAACLLASPGTGFSCAEAFFDVEEHSDGVIYMGYVTDDKGKPIPQATIIIPASDAEIQADRNGQFVYSLGSPEDDPTIIFVCKKEGYKTTRAEKKAFNHQLITLLCAMPPED